MLNIVNLVNLKTTMTASIPRNCGGFAMENVRERSLDFTDIISNDTIRASKGTLPHQGLRK